MITKDQMLNTSWITVLNDNDTYTNLECCWIAVISIETVDLLNSGQMDVDEIDEDDRYDLGSMLQWAIEHGYFDKKASK